MAKPNRVNFREWLSRDFIKEKLYSLDKILTTNIVIGKNANTKLIGLISIKIKMEIEVTNISLIRNSHFKARRKVAQKCTAKNPSANIFPKVSPK